MNTSSNTKLIMQSLVKPLTRQTSKQQQQQVLSLLFKQQQSTLNGVFGMRSFASQFASRGQYSDRNGGRSSGQFYEKGPDSYIRQGDFKAKKDVIQTLTLEDIQDKVTMADLHADTQRKLQQNGVQELLPVQQATYALFLKDHEIVVKSRTGTGKTLSFLLPLEQLIRNKKEEMGKHAHEIHAIILEPTRELASQVQAQVEKFTNLKSVLVYGGGDRRDYQMRQIEKGRPDILVCTPGRLIDLLTNSGLMLNNCQYQILDEGDKMLDMGFEQDIMEIQKHLPDGSRSMIFSATVPAFIQELAKKKFENPILIDLVGNDTNQVPERIENRGVLVADDKMRAKHVRHYIEENRDKKIIIFTETKQEARDFEKETYANFITLHGDLEQSARETRLTKYRQKGSRHILVATDVASRGLDIDDIDVVIQLGCRHIDSFVHRSGRTGRVGKNGLNIIFFDKEDFKFVLNLEDELNIKVNITTQLIEKDQEEAQHKIVEDFEKKALKRKPVENLDIVTQMKEEIYDKATEEKKNQMLTFLLQNYLHSHLHLPTQISFLTGNPHLSTFSLKLTGPKTKEFSNLKTALREYFIEQRIENNFEQKGDQMIYLADLSESQEVAIQELIGEIEGIETDFQKVISLDEELKSIISKRFSGNSFNNSYKYDRNSSRDYDRNSRDGGSSRGGYGNSRRPFKSDGGSNRGDGGYAQRREGGFDSGRGGYNRDQQNDGNRGGIRGQNAGRSSSGGSGSYRKTRDDEIMF